MSAEARRGLRTGRRGARAHWLDFGPQGAPVALLIHGLGGLAQEIAAPLAAGLAAAGLRVVALDRPGYGFSDPRPAADMGPRRQAAWLASGLADLGLRPALLIAHSFGASVALWLAQGMEPQPRLLLINPFCRPTPPAAAPLLRLAHAPAIGPLVRRRLAPMVGRRLLGWHVRQASAPDPLPATLAHLPAELVLQETALVAMAAELRAFNADACGLPEAAARLRQPIVALTGSHDRVIEGEAHGAWLAACLPQVEHRRARAGHMLHHTHPRLAVEAARRLQHEALPP